MNSTRASLNKAYSKAGNKILLFLVLAAAVACRKKDDFYLNTSPTEELFTTVIDTGSFDLMTLTKPKVASKNLSAVYLGRFQDPVFGLTTAGVYSDLTPPPGLPVFDSAVFEKMVLYLKVSPSAAAIGDTDSKQVIKVYEINSAIDGDQNYYSDTTINTGEEGGSIDGKLARNGDIVEIPLTDVFAKKLFAAPQGTFNDKNSFRSYFKGIAIVPEGVSSGAGAIIPFDLNDLSSGIRLFYHTAKNPATATYFMSFLGGTNISFYRHNYSGSFAGASIGKTDQPFSYIQSLAGLRSRLILPDLSGLIANNMIAIHRAELYLPRSVNSSDPYDSAVPRKLYIYPAGPNGEDSLKGFTDDLLSYYDGNYSDTSKGYHFIITRYVQEMLYNIKNGRPTGNYGMNISVPVDNPISAGRVVLYGKNTTGANRPRLILVYSKLHR